MSSLTVKLSTPDFTGTTLPGLQRLINDISQAERFIYNQVEQAPEQFIGHRVPPVVSENYSAMLERSRSLSRLAFNEGLLGGTVVDELEAEKDIDDLTQRSYFELETLIHTYLATARGVILELIDQNRHGGEALPSLSTLYTLQEIAKHVFVVQNLLALSNNNAQRKYFYSSLERELPEILRLPDERMLYQVTQKELRNYAIVNLASADAMAEQLRLQNANSSISGDLDLISLATCAAKKLLEVRIIQERPTGLKLD